MTSWILSTYLKVKKLKKGLMPFFLQKTERFESKNTKQNWVSINTWMLFPIKSQVRPPTPQQIKFSEIKELKMLEFIMKGAEKVQLGEYRKFIFS